VGLPDPEWGNRVVAVVSLVEPVESLPLDEARDWVAERHPRSWAPRELVVVPALPMLANGKVDRLAVRRLAREAR
jgi:O-succinylbenzoic acid--CoA ligase